MKAAAVALLVAVAPDALGVSPSRCEIKGDVTLAWEGFENGVSRRYPSNPQNDDYWRLEIDRVENTWDPNDVLGDGSCWIFLLLSADSDPENASGWWLAESESGAPGADGGTVVHDVSGGSGPNKRCFNMSQGDWCSDIVLAGPKEGDHSGCDERHVYIEGSTWGCSVSDMPVVPPGEYYAHVYTAWQIGLGYHDVRTLPGTFTVGGPSEDAPDLRVQSASLSHSSRNRGESFTLSAEVRNRGGGPAPASTLRYYRSADSAIGSSDEAVGTDSVPGLAAGEKSAQSISLRAPNSDGTWYYGACVDAVSGEANPANNCSYGARLRVGEGGGDGGSPGANEHRLPLFLSASRTKQQGFARVANLSSRAGEVRIRAVDDSGTERGPVSISIGARAVVHFNSDDLETGNAAKGIAGGIGSGSGDWRLVLDTNLEISASVFARASDGFLSNVDDVVASAGGRSHVRIFNPGSNTNQRSWLRLINPGGESAEVTITGRDDRGATAPEGDVRLTLGAGMSRAVTAAELESGTQGLTGRLGDGSGKWRLTVASDRPIRVMSLLDTPTGSIANLSRPGVEREAPAGALTPMTLIRARPFPGGDID